MDFLKLGGTYILLEDLYGIEISSTFKTRVPFILKTGNRGITSWNDEGLRYFRNILIKDSRFLQLTDKIFVQPKYITVVDSNSLQFRNGEILTVTSLNNVDEAVAKISSFLKQEKDLLKDIESLKAQVAALNAKIDELMYIPEGPVAIEAEKSFNELKERQ